MLDQVNELNEELTPVAWHQKMKIKEIESIFTELIMLLMYAI